MNRDPTLYLLDQRTERRIAVTIAFGLACILAAIATVQCGKTAPVPVEPPWPPPAAVVDALPAEVTPTCKEDLQVQPAADPSPVTAAAVWRTDAL